MRHSTSEPMSLPGADHRSRPQAPWPQRMDSTGNWYPLSRGQEALWFLWRLAPQSWAYNIPLPVVVHGPLDVPALHRALQKLSDRHPCLRTAFQEEGGTPRQRALPQYAVPLEPIDASQWSTAQLNEAVRDTARQPFDLEVSATLRVTLWRRGDESHVLLLVLPHIVSDLWSFIVLMDELKELYPAEKAGRACHLPDLRLCYEDYVHWQRQWLTGEAAERLWEYWREELAGELPVLDLPADHARPPLQPFRGGTITRQLDAELTRQLKQQARSEGVTLFMALLAAYQVLLHRYTGQDDILVGTPTAGRPQAELTGLIGDFVNMVPMRADLRGTPSFRQLLKHIRAQVVGAIKYQDYPFSRLVERLQPARDLSRTPIFQTTFVLQKFHRFEELSRVLLPSEDEPAIPFADLLLEPIPLAQQDGQFDVNLEMKEDEAGRLVGAWKYSTALFEADTVARMAGHFETLLRELVAHPERPVADLRLLTDAESRRAVVEAQGRQVALPGAASVGALFDAQSERRPEAIAVSCGEASLTYAALGRRVTGLARCLVERGVGRGDVVAVLMPRGLDFVTALLAVSKAGGAFLPLDPRHPLAHTVRVLDGSGTRLVLTSGELAPEVSTALANLPGARGPQVVTLAQLAWAHASGELPAVQGTDLAYVMYTSGSTGEPKGVMVEHRGMVNHVLGKLSDLGMGADDILAQNGPQSFDIVVWQCLAPLVVGGQVVVFPDEVAEDPAKLVAEVERRSVTVLQLVPSMLRALLEEITAVGAPPLARLRWMVPTGEALPTELCRRWFEVYPHIPVLNTYGSTECSDDQCHYALRRLGPADAAVAVASIGMPIQNMAAYVLDRHLAPVPVGVVGDLYIGGVGVGRGYCHDPIRSATAFIPDPYSSHPGARMYRTRDLARRRVDGNLDFLGRVDNMIKLRGFRIEPGEIEAALSRHPVIAGAAVLARTDPAGERRLVGYVVLAPQHQSLSDAPPGAETLRQFLASSLPQYMVPTHFCFLDRLPLTANGKLDQRRLPEPAWHITPAEQLIAPRTPTEALLADCWAAVLGRERVGVTQDFFAIGGDSILSIQIVARCKRAGLHLRPSDLFQYSTIAALAALADGNAPSAGDGSDVESTDQLASLQVSREHLEIALGQVDFDAE